MLKMHKILKNNDIDPRYYNMTYLINNDSRPITCLRSIGRLPHLRIAIEKIYYKKYERKYSKYFHFDTNVKNII